MSQDELNKSNVPDPEVVPRAKRRRFSAEYKLHILAEADACSERGQIGSLLRREGLNSSHLTTWRHQRAQGQLEALSPKNRGRKPSVNESLVKELAELKRDTQRLENPQPERQCQCSGIGWLNLRKHQGLTVTLLNHVRRQTAFFATRLCASGETPEIIRVPRKDPGEIANRRLQEDSDLHAAWYLRLE